MNACEFTSQLHHSDDLIAVFHGVNCTPGSAECVFDGEHNGTADAS